MKDIKWLLRIPGFYSALVRAAYKELIIKDIKSEAEGRDKPSQNEMRCKKCNEPYGFVRQGNLIIKGFCQKCLYDGQLDESLDSVCKITITDVKSLVCSYCTQVFNSVELFDEHCDVRQRSTYACKECESVFCNEVELTKHKTLHPPEPITLKIPIASSKKKSKAKPKTSSSAQSRTKRNVNKSRQSEAAKRPMTKRVKMTSCFLCVKRVPANALSEHLKTHARETESLLSVKRGVRKSNDKDVQDEMKVDTPLEKETPARKEPITIVKFEYSCNVCQEKFDNLDSLLNHLNGDSHVNNIVKITGANLSCKLCDNVYSNISELRTHVVDKKHLLSYNLEICNKHVSMCVDCNAYFVDDANLKTHQYICHDEANVNKRENESKPRTPGLSKLDDSDDDYDNNSDKGATSSDSSQSYTCKICKQHFDFKTRFINHIKRFHHQSVSNYFRDESVDDEIPAENPVTKESPKLREVGKAVAICLTCGLTFLSVSGMIRHTKKFRHKGQKVENVDNTSGASSDNSNNVPVSKDFVCGKCEKVFDNGSLLKSHTLTCENKDNINKEVKDLKLLCTRCGASFSSETERIFHCLSERHFVSSFKIRLHCSCCKDSYMLGVYNLARHIKTSTHIENHIQKVTHGSFCKLCNSYFRDTAEGHIECSSHVNAYIKTLTVNPPKVKDSPTPTPKKDVVIKTFDCNICSAKFYKQSYLSRHMCSHNKMFDCTYCNKKFSFNYLLQGHLKTCAFNI